MIELLAITPNDPIDDLQCVEAWVDAGVERCAFAVLVRCPGATPARTLDTHAHTIDACRRHAIPLLLSTSVADLPAAQSLALAERFAGLQLRGDPAEADLARARARVGDALWLGRSCHGTPQPGDQEVDYTCWAPVFAPRTSANWEKTAQGVAALGSWCTPERWIIALGGITAATAPACLAAGARGLASIATFLGPCRHVADNVGRLVELVVSARHVPTP